MKLFFVPLVELLVFANFDEKMFVKMDFWARSRKSKKVQISELCLIDRFNNKFLHHFHYFSCNKVSLALHQLMMVRNRNS